MHAWTRKMRLTSPLLRWSILAGVLLIFAVTNLPWTLDDNDQAKQAYTSFEMVRQGHWLYQHTPNEAVATKPPLVGWISSALYEVTLLLGSGLARPIAPRRARPALVARARGEQGPWALAGLFAMTAFGLNLLSARLATLVRTDMPLRSWVFLIGLSDLAKNPQRRKVEHARSSDPLRPPYDHDVDQGSDRLRLHFSGACLLSIAPTKRSGGSSAWSGWWPWILSLAIFLLWVVGGIVRQPGFYESVVLKEFAGRFTETVHKPQPIYFYLPHLLQKFAPWSLLVIGLAVVFWRRRARPHASHALAHLLDRGGAGSDVADSIETGRPHFPSHSAALLIVRRADRSGLRRRRAAEKSPTLADGIPHFRLLFSPAVTQFGKWGTASAKGKGALVRFSREVRREAARNHWRYAVVGGHEEGMLLYLQCDHFLAPNEAAKRWQSGQLDALVVQEKLVRSLSSRLPGAKQALVSEKSGFVSRYSLFVRAAP